jgi:hypothetical protein
MPPTPAHVAAGQAVYSRRLLNAYDLIVLGVSNRFIWRCPTPKLLAHYNRHVSANHLDVGVGTGYFLDRCTFPSPSPRIALMDLNPNSLDFAAKRIARYSPETYIRNVLEPIDDPPAAFDSVGVNYLLPGAVIFGATLLQGGVRRNWAAKRLMKFYNAKGIFTNTQDDLAGLDRELRRRFRNVTIEPIGSAATFAATHG